MSFAKVLRSAGLGVKELATVYGVTRQSIHAWRHGVRPQAGSIAARMFEQVTRGLVAAMPLSLTAGRTPARQKAVAVLARRLQNLPPAK